MNTERRLWESGSGKPRHLANVRTYLAEDGSQVQRTYWRVNCAWIIKGGTFPGSAVLCPFKMSPDLVNPLPGGRTTREKEKEDRGGKNEGEEDTVETVDITKRNRD